MAQSIEIVRGTTNTIECGVIDAAGNPYTVNPGETVILGVKKKAADEALVLKKAAFVEDTGVYHFRLYPEDTEAMECGRYVYDISLQAGENFYNIIEASPFIITQEITTWGCMT